MKFHALRLNPGADLRPTLESWAKDCNIKAAAIVSLVGSLSTANLRFAGAPQGSLLTGPFEITSFVGTLSMAGGHFHLTIADGRGLILGGHLCTGSLVHTTCEVVLLSSDSLEFLRQFDPISGYKELVIKE